MCKRIGKPKPNTTRGALALAAAAAVLSLASPAVPAQDVQESDPDQAAPVPQLPHNLAMIGPAARAAARSGLPANAGQQAVAAGANKDVGLAGSAGLTAEQLHYLAARGVPIVYSLCGVNLFGGGRASMPVVRSDININCPVANVAFGR